MRIQHGAAEERGSDSGLFGALFWLLQFPVSRTARVNRL